jgi:hypothetical protein
MTPLRALCVLVLVGVGCGPTGQVRVAQQLVCDADGTNCQMAAVAQRDYTASDRFWQVLLTILANGVGGHH